MGSGVVAGFPVVDVKVQLVDGKYHDVDSLGIGVRNRIARGIPRSAEPKASGPARADHEGRSGDSGRLHRLGLGDLNSRRGQIQGQDMRGNANVINANGAAHEHVSVT